jgi:hypothetical protein
MLKTVLMSAFAVALFASPSEAQERRTCAVTDIECIRRGGEPQAREDERSCKWNDMECIRREQDRERRAEDRDDPRADDRRGDDRGRYERGDDRRDRDGRWERERRGRDPYMRSSRMPRMASALAMRNGRGIPGDARPWVGNGPVRVELSNRDRDRVPERARIRIVGTNETQVWVDRNNDGRVDLMQFYRNGRLVRELK